MKMIPSSDVLTEHRPSWILPLIIVSEFAGTSLWFATNAVLPDLQKTLSLSSDGVGIITSSVQFGFIVGTFCFAFFTIADRISPRKLFSCCCLAGALFNISVYFFPYSFTMLLLLRFLTGCCLAGIYPVGMKIASGWFREGLGNALGFLVGSLVLGTSFPFLIRSFNFFAAWSEVIVVISAIALVGGILMLFVPDGPYLGKSIQFNSGALKLIFQSKELRSAAFGYFGHMWELYTFYAFVPFYLSTYFSFHHLQNINLSFWSFVIIASGCIGCIGGGIISRWFGSGRVAWVQLCCSGICCLCSPLLIHLPVELFLGVLIFWGIVVVGDSPQFSALIAAAAPRELVGSALTIGNSIGFAITIVSIETVSFFSRFTAPEYIFLILTIGPLLGLISLSRIVLRR